MNLWVIFLTGLTTGGLTCLAVQGGLLATALAKQVSVTPQSQQSKSKQKTITGIQIPKHPAPVLYFLIAKLFAYTVLGFLLGALGATFQITPAVQAIIMLVAGLFMLATALNMFNVHPIFRYFVIQPPKALTRLVRNQAKSQEAFTPILLGAMTVLIPCGTTQAMEVLAISSGNAITGALILFVFVLGTSPTFFALGFLATRIRGNLGQMLALVAACLILFLSLVSIDGGLNLLGSSLAPSRILASLLPSNSGYSGTPEQAVLVDGTQEITIVANDRGYVPNYFAAASGQPIRLRLTTNGNYSCTSSFAIPSLGIQEFLPETGEVLVEIAPQRPGTLYFTCGMGMYNGAIVIS